MVVTTDTKECFMCKINEEYQRRNVMNHIIVKHYYKDVVKKTRAVENLKNRIKEFRITDMLADDVINELLFNRHKFITMTKEYSHTIAMGYNKETKTVYIGWSMLNAVDVKKRLNFKKIGHSMAVSRLASIICGGNHEVDIPIPNNIPHIILKDGFDLVKFKGSKYFKSEVNRIGFYVGKEVIFKCVQI